MLTVGSLFSGIGGLELGLERAGMQVVWQVESDDYARAVLAKRWPNVARYTDVQAVGRGLPRVDVICGGFPCQDLSYAGKGVGIDGSRSGLWSEFARIVRELRPRYVVVENVPALLSRGMGRVLGDLAESGYDAEWDCIPASAVGANHRRDRVFIVAHAISKPVRMRSPDDAVSSGEDKGREEERERVRADASERGASLADAAVVQRDGGEDNLGCDRQGTPPIPEPRDRSRSSATDPAGQGLEGRQESKAARPTFGTLRRDSWWEVEPDVGRVADGVPTWVDRLRCLGNAVVPQVAEVIGRMIVACELSRSTPTV